MRDVADAGTMEAAGFNQERNPDDVLSVRFSIEPVENPAKSKEAGRPIYDDMEIIEIRVPGDKDVVRHPVSDGDRLRFGRHYQAWKANTDQALVSGTPLSAWPLIKRSQVEEARFFALHSVEQLSEVSDANLQRLGPGWPTLRDQARDWLKKAKDGAMLAKLRSELEERDRRITALEDMLKRQANELHRPANAPGPAPVNADFEALKAQVAALAATRNAVPVPEEPPKKKRGRPSKADIAAREAAKNGKG